MAAFGPKIQKKNVRKSRWGGMILAVGDFFQYLHELTEIVRQQGDPRLAEVMSHIRTGD